MTICKSCHKAESKARYHKTKNNQASRDRLKNYRDKNRERLREWGKAYRSTNRKRVSKYKTPCVICGEDWSSAVAFHHLLPEEKLFGLSQKIHTRTDVEIEAEVGKCICLCFNCHQKYHSGHQEVGAIVNSIRDTRAK